MGIELDKIDWLEPWYPLDRKIAETLEVELKREATGGHPLHNVEVRAIAKRDDRDDALFLTKLGDKIRYAVVHLTWRGAAETSAAYPSVRFFDSFEAWIVGGMKADHEEYIL